MGQRVAAVNTKTAKTLSEIEETQEALRESIEQARRLAEKSDGLLQKHKHCIEEQEKAAQRSVFLRDNPL